MQLTLWATPCPRPQEEESESEEEEGAEAEPRGAAWLTGRQLAELSLDRQLFQLLISSGAAGCLAAGDGARRAHRAPPPPEPLLGLTRARTSMAQALLA